MKTYLRSVHRLHRNDYDCKNKGLQLVITLQDGEKAFEIL